MTWHIIANRRIERSTESERKALEEARFIPHALVIEGTIEDAVNAARLMQETRETN
jgi:hypothetical protein